MRGHGVVLYSTKYVGLSEVRTYIPGGRRGERLVHATLDGQLDVLHVYVGLLGMRSVNFCILNNGRYIS